MIKAHLPWYYLQSRRHGGASVGLGLQTKLQAPLNWNMKHYKSV